MRRQCAVALCAQSAPTAVRHPHRPEPVTWMCDRHAEVAAQLEETTIVEEGQL